MNTKEHIAYEQTNIQRTGAQKRVSMSLELQQVSTVVDGHTHIYPLDMALKPNSLTVPLKKLANEKPQGKTIAYETLLNAWKEGRVR